MNTLQRTAAAIALAGLLAACGSADDAPRSDPPPIEDTAFGEMVNTMDTARGVEDTNMQRKEAVDRALQETEGAADAH